MNIAKSSFDSVLARKHGGVIDFQGNDAMKFVAVAIMLSGLAAAGAANAKASDADYLKANRCLGLASSESLGQVDTQALQAFIDAEGRMRTTFVLHKGEEELKRATREARTTNTQRVARLSAELSGACQSLMSEPQTTQAQKPAAQPRS